MSAKLINKYLQDEFIPFNWEFGGEKVFLKILYMPKSSLKKKMTTQHEPTKMREFTFPMVKQNYYDFNYEINLNAVNKSMNNNAAVVQGGNTKNEATTS